MRLTLALFCVATSARAEAPVDWTRSACLATKPSSAAHLVRVREGAAWYLKADDLEPLADAGGEQLACLDEAPRAGTRQRLILLRANVATLYFVDGAALTELPASPSTWKEWREPADESGETGCLRRFKPGTRLFDRPDGDVVGLVVGRSAFLGKWSSAKTATGWWAMTRARAGGAWVRVPSDRDWCD